MRVPLVDSIGIQNHRGVVIKANVGAIFTTIFLRTAHDDGTYLIALLDTALRCC